MKFYIYTLGCKLNYSDSAHIAKTLEQQQWEQVQNPQDAHLIIINSCAVTTQAEKKTRQAFSRLKKINPLARFAIVGCAIDINKNEFVSLVEPEDYILTNQEKYRLADIVNKKTTIEDLPFVLSYNTQHRTRSFLKIQDGCDYFCTYCAIPYARGRSRNASIPEVLNAIEDIINKGIKEIVLTGINIASFKTPDGKTYFDLLVEIEKRFNHEDIRIRIGNPEPNLLTKDIIHLVAESKIFMPHFHIPLQSGSNTILKKMNRKYTAEEYSELIYTIKELLPDACIAADVIAGFPGETDELFEETLAFIEKIPISYLHVFSYSDRPQSRSFSLPQKLTPSQIQKRTNTLIDLSREKTKAFLSSQLNKVRPVLIEKCKGKFSEGYTDNYIYCQIEGKFESNKIVPSILQHIEEEKEEMFMLGKPYNHD